MVGTFESFETAIRHGQAENALLGISRLMESLPLDFRSPGVPFPFPKLDDLCGEIGSSSAFELLTPDQTLIENDHDILLITEATVQGGHAEFIRDIAAFGDLPVVVVSTNLYDRKNTVLPEIREHPRVVSVVELDSKSWLNRLRILQTIAANPHARRIFVLCHGHDSVAISAVARVTEKPVLFLHHVDHTATLGCHLKYATHIDLHNLGFARCKTHLIAEPRYICLTSRDNGSPAVRSDRSKPMFKSATCGGEHKLTRVPYPLSYSDVVCRVLAAHGGIHFHLGPISNEFISSVRVALRAARLSEDSFIALGHVSGLRDILDALEIDLYIPTLPHSGGKAAIDAMSAGIPILVHENAWDRQSGGGDLVYPEAPGWSNIDELDAELKKFSTLEYLSDQAVASRKYFERYHSNDLFTKMLRSNGISCGADVPDLRQYRPDFDERMRAEALVSRNS
jgi:hypothetical protein